MKVNIKLNGMDKLEREANKLIKEVQETNTKTLKTEASQEKAEFRKAAPRGPTGNLKAAAYAKVYPPTLTRRQATAFIGFRPRKAPHSRLVEAGHKGPHPAPAHPFFLPVVERTLPEIYRRIVEAMKRAVES